MESITLKNLLLAVLIVLSLQVHAQTVSKTVHVAEAGTLPELITESEKNKITDLTLTGSLNGTDIRFIREMATYSIGKLKSLDVLEVNIVSGGDSYYNLKDVNYYTENNKIGDYMFRGSNRLSKITLPNNIISIGHYAFYDCSIYSITIPQNVTYIGYGVFNECQSLEKISVSTLNQHFTAVNDVLFNKDKTIIVAYPFQKQASTYTIPNSVITIEKFAFLNNPYLTFIQIPNSVKHIGDSAFEGCLDLKTIAMGNNVTTIGDRAFYLCTELTSINLPNSINSLGEYAFTYCWKLSSINIGSGIEQIKQYTFSDCISLSTINIGSSITDIGFGAFTNCSNLRTVNISGSVMNIENEAFYNCNQLEKFIVSNANQNFSTIEGVLFNKNKTTLLKYPNAKGSSYIIPKETTTIGNSAFASCVDLANITISKNITIISENAFADCSNLEFAEIIGNGSTTIKNFAFSECTNLKKVIIGNGISDIENYAFNGCGAINELQLHHTIPLSITNEALNSINKQTCVLYVPIGTVGLYTSAPVWKDFMFIDDGSLSSEFTTLHVAQAGSLPTLISASDKNNITHLKLSGFLNGTDIKFIREMAGAGVYNYTPTDGKLNVLDISNTYIVEGGGNYYYSYNAEKDKIGDYMFNQCKTLTNILLPKTIKSTGNEAFSDCTSLLSLTFPDNIEQIGRFTFYRCNELISITIGSGVESIGDFFVYGCFKLKEINVSKENLYYSSIDGVLFNKDQTIILNYPNDKGSNYIIPNKIETIGQSAFITCSNLMSITIPSSVSNIGDYAFAECYNLNEIHVHKFSPINISPYEFRETNKETCTLYVPEGSYNLYRNAPVWGEFTNIIEEFFTSNKTNTSNPFNYSISGGTLKINNLKENSLISLYDVNGKLMLQESNLDDTMQFVLPNRGVYVIIVSAGVNTESVKIIW